MDRYKDYTAIQLATDAAFISWVKCPDAANGLFWEEYINKYPSQSNTVRKARGIVSQMHIVEEKMAESKGIGTWEKIRMRINKMPAGKRRTPIVSMGKYWVAAAVLLLLISGSWLLTRHDKTATFPVAAGIAKTNDLAPGGNKAILTLADGRKVVLDSADNGAITKQGNVTVIKLDGQLAYNKVGHTAATQVLYNTITTPRGGQYQLVLADGTRVWLNAASSLRFPTVFVDGERKVEMTGEGYFEVAHNAKMPFTVHLYDGSYVQVLGTHFNINSYEDEANIKTTLLEGMVKVANGDKTALLKPGQQSRINNISHYIDIKEGVDLEGVMAWKNGLFEFNEANIKTIMRQIARWYDVDVVFEGQVPEKRFNGKIYRNVNASEVLNILEAGGIHFKIEGKKVIVTP